MLFECDLPPASAVVDRVLSEDAARKLQGMLSETVKSGTARRIFHERNYSLDDAAGKTGSLSDKKPFRDYTWFVGYAPASNPRVAVAAVIVNDPFWRIRATWLGREAMRLYLSRLPEPLKRKDLAASVETKKEPVAPGRVEGRGARPLSAEPSAEEPLAKEPAAADSAR